MTLSETATLAGIFLQTIGLAAVLFKLVWGGATSHQENIAATRNDFATRIEIQTTNFGNVIASVGDRIHQLELKAMEFRAIAAEMYMRRDSYYKAADEFKRDVKDAHDDLKHEMSTGFENLREQINAVSMSIEENRRTTREN